MHDDLVKRLRHFPEDFVAYKMGADFARTVREAADAIENTSNAYQMMAEAYEAEVTKQRWIPVTERLPGKDDTVVFHYAWTGRSGTVYKDFTIATLAEIEYQGSKPLAWMPLPQPPKEECEHG